MNRPRDAAGAVVATLDDYAAVRDLAGDLIAEAIGATVPGSVRETVAAVAAIATRPGIYATVRQIADRLGIERPSSSQADHGGAARLRDQRPVQARPAGAVRGRGRDAHDVQCYRNLYTCAHPHGTPWCASLTSENAFDWGVCRYLCSGCAAGHTCTAPGRRDERFGPVATGTHPADRARCSG